jgi:tripartite-type tricarboxylate transporter receptor subunit TctC
MRATLSRRAFVGSVPALLLPAASLSMAQDRWPSRPIRVVSPFPAGGINDLIARVVTEKISPALAQPIVVEAKTGAGGNIGTDFVAKSEPDGYTWLASSGPVFTAAPALSKSLPFDPIKDFRAAAMLATAANILVVPPQLPVNNLRELVQYAKTAPGGISYATPGAGSSAHLGTEAFMRDAGFKATQVVYRGAPPALLDLIGGRVRFMMVSASLAATQIAAGKLKGLAVMDTHRFPGAPDIPTVAQAGFDIQPVVPWFGLHVPAKTPDAVVMRIHREVQTALADADVVARLRKAGATPAMPMTPAQIDAELKAQAAAFERLVKDNHIEKQ